MFCVEQLLPDITFKTSRSGGKGGQNVNKVSSKAELNFNLSASAAFSAEEKERIRYKLVKRLTAEGAIQVISQEDRSQLANKERCLEKLAGLLRAALHVQKKRKVSKPGKIAVQKRLDNKKQQALKKLLRRKDMI